MTSTLSEEDRRELRRELFRGAVLSSIFSLFKSRKKQAAERGEKFLLQDLADRAGITKSQASRWFNGGEAPNWRLSTVYDLAEALDGEITFEVVDRRTNDVHGASGIKSHVTHSGNTAIRPHMFQVNTIGLNMRTAMYNWSLPANYYSYSQTTAPQHLYLEDHRARRTS